MCYNDETSRCAAAPAWSIPSSNGPGVLPALVRGALEVTMTTGTVKKIVADRGFGFITAEGGKEYFFHRDALGSSLTFARLTEATQVQFEIETSPKGPRAAQVRAV